MCKEIPLSRGMVALVDDAEYERVSRYKWCLDSSGYACRMESYYVDGKRKRRKVLMHRFILDAPAHLQVDHINHEFLDNRRCNMRLVTSRQNRANSRPKRTGTSRYKGVHWHKRDRKWCVTFWAGSDKQWLGTYASEEEAARVHDRKALEVNGEFAYLNFPTHKNLYLAEINVATTI